MNIQLMIKVRVVGHKKPFYYTKPLNSYSDPVAGTLEEFARVHKFNKEDCTIMFSQVQGDCE